MAPTDTSEKSTALALRFAEDLPLPILILDLDGRCEFANFAWSAYTGMSAAEARDWAWLGAIDPLDHAALREMWSKDCRLHAAARLRRADGSYQRFQFRGSPMSAGEPGDLIWMFGVEVKDRSDSRPQAPSAAAAEGEGLPEIQLRTIIDTIPATVFCSLGDGSGGFWNQRWRDYAGMDSDEAANGGWNRVIHPEDLEKVARAWNQAMASGEAGEVEVRLRRADGAYRWFLSRWEPLRDPTGRITNWYGANTDIHDRMIAEDTLAAARMDLAAFSRATSLGMMAAAIAHEVNQPLAGVIINSETGLRMLAAEPRDHAGVQRTLERALRDGRRARDIVERLRSLFQGDAASNASVELNEITRELMVLTGSELNRYGVRTILDLDDTLPPAVGDKVGLQQVIQNLVLNAAEAMRDLPRTSRHLIIRTGWGAGGEIEMSVQDAGSGFAAEEAERLFDAFYTTKPAGMGIGLSIARQIVARHGGHLWAELNTEGGATFRFTLPQAKAAGRDGPWWANHPETQHTRRGVEQSAA